MRIVGSRAVHCPARKVVPELVNGFEEAPDGVGGAERVSPFHTRGT